MVSVIMKDGAKYGLGKVVGYRKPTAEDRRVSEEMTRNLVKEMGIKQSDIRFE